MKNLFSASRSEIFQKSWHGSGYVFLEFKKIVTARSKIDNQDSPTVVIDKVRTLLVDDHRIFVEGMTALLDASRKFEIIGKLHSGEAALEKVRELKPDLVTMDISMSGIDGIETCRRIRKQFPQARVLILSSFDERRFVVSAFQAGAAGYLIKSSYFNEILTAAEEVMKGGKYLSGSLSAGFFQQYFSELPAESQNLKEHLSQREQEVLKGIAEGQNTKTMATELGVSVKTIETHRLNLMRKLKIDNIADLTKYAIRSGLTSL